MWCPTYGCSFTQAVLLKFRICDIIHTYIYTFQRSRWPLQVNRGHTAPRASRLPRYGSRARLPGGRHGSHSQPLRTTGVIVAMLPRMWNAPTFTRKCTVDILCIFNRSFLNFLLYLLFFDVFLFIYDIILLVLSYTVGLPLVPNPAYLCAQYPLAKGGW